MAVGGNAIRAGQAFIELFADKSKLVADLKIAESSIRQWGFAVAKVGLGITAAGLSVLGPILGASKVFADMGSELADASAQTGIAVEALSALKFSAEQTGADLGTVEAGARKLSKTIGEAAAGNKEAAKSLAELGLSAAGLRSLSAGEQFTTVLQKIGAIQDTAQRTRLAMDLLGKSGTGLLGMAAGLEGLMAQARQFNLGISSSDAELADALGDALDLLWATVKRTTFAIGAALAPALTTMANAAAGAVAIVSKWIDGNRGAVVVVAAAAAGAVALGIAITGVGVALMAASAVTTGWTALLMILNGTMAWVTATATAMWLAITGPIGLTVIAIGAVAVAAVTAFMIFTDSGRRCASAIAAAFSRLWQTITLGMGGVMDALISADWDMVGGLIGLTLSAAFARAMADMAGMLSEIDQVMLGLSGWKKTAEQLELALTAARILAGAKRGALFDPDKFKLDQDELNPLAATIKQGASGTFSARAAQQMGPWEVLRSIDDHVVEVRDELRQGAKAAGKADKRIVMPITIPARKMQGLDGKNPDGIPLSKPPTLEFE